MKIFIPHSHPLINYQRMAYYFRGAILNDTSSLEVAMEDFISAFFFKDNEGKRLTFQNLLSKTFKNFDTKSNIFLEILTDNSLLPAEGMRLLREDLKDIGSKRNIAAHWILASVEEEYLKLDMAKPSIRLMRLKKGAIPSDDISNKLEYMDFTHELMAELIPKIQGCIGLIQIIRDKINI